jgi:phosphatidate cytidylyltransferase
MKNFAARSLTGIAYVALISLGILYNSYSFLALFSIVTVLCLREFYSLINAKRQAHVNLWFSCFGGLLLFVTTFLYSSGVYNDLIFSFYLLYLVIAFIYELYGKKSDPIAHIACLILGQVYIALPLAVLNVIAFHSDAWPPIYSSVLVFSLFAFIWANDTGAYLIGITFGKHRLFERISPKKSWEGFFGGLVFAVVVAFVFAHFIPEIPFYHWVGMSIAVVVFGTWGDLFESLIKRNLEVKDSGQALPGHGGFLDRFDSLFLAIYVMLFYIEVFQP